MPDSTFTPRIPEAIQALREVLVLEKASGTERITLSADSVKRLHELPGYLQGRPAAPQAQAPAPRMGEEKLIAPSRQTDPPATAVAPSVTPASPSTLQPQGATKAEKIAWLAREAERCEECRGLGTLREVVVFSVGNPDADLMFVGEAPGFEEERQQEPFVGPAGQKLTQIIKAMGLRRPEDVYISNIVKFRPMKGDPRFQGQQNRKPEPREMAASLKYVLAEIEIVRPKVIVALGATAAEGLLEKSGAITRMRNQFHDLRGTPVMVTYHPSYLLRTESNSPDGGKGEKRKVWEDMLMVMERLGLPISDKQRGYFL